MKIFQKNGAEGLR